MSACTLHNLRCVQASPEMQMSARTIKCGGAETRLAAVDVEDALLRRHKLEVDEVGDGPDGVIRNHHGHQLGLDCRRNVLGVALLTKTPR